MKINWSGIGESILANKVKLIIIALAAVVLVGAVLWIWSSVGEWNFYRGVEGKKANVNAAIDELKQVNANIAVEKKTEQEIIANVKMHTKDYFDAVNVTDSTREAVNAAIERQQKAANSNRQANAADVEEAMKGL